MKKKRRGRAAGRVANGVTCLRCLENKVSADFTPNEKLLYAVCPWCKPCMKWKNDIAEGVERADARTLYEKHYQSRYHPKYRAKKTGKAAKRVKRLTHTLMRGVLEEEFDIEALRRPEVQAYLAYIWNDLAGTTTWKEFEESVEAEAEERCQGCGEYDPLRVVRLFDVKIYPELALYGGNTLMLCEECKDAPDRCEHIGLLFNHEGLEQAIARLRECLLEVE